MTRYVVLDGLERLRLETFLKCLGIISFLKVEHLDLISVSRVWKNVSGSSRS